MTKKKYKGASVTGFTAGFIIELLALAILRPILDADPHDGQLYILWVWLGAAAIAVLLSHFLGERRWVTLIALPIVLYAASMVVWFSAFWLSCGDIQTPFFRVQCN